MVKVQDFGTEELIAALKERGFDVLMVRREVREFALAMEAKLAANDHKGGWKQDGAFSLFGRLVEESGELSDALIATTAEPRRVLHEAVDVANFAMMIADVAGGLRSTQIQEETKMPETNELTIRCPMCEQVVAVTKERTIATHDGAPPCRAVCGFSGASIDGPGTKMGCDRCYCTLFVGERDTWPTVEQAVAAAHAAGWTGDARFSLCAECSKGGA